MKFYIWKKNLLHKCHNNTFDNFYILKKDSIYCQVCCNQAPISIILGFKIQKDETGLYSSVGENKVMWHIKDFLDLSESLKSFEVE